MAGYSQVEFKIPTTRTRNDSLFCCALLRGTARISLLGGAANPRGHQSGIKGEVPALTFDPEREDSN